MIDAGRMIIAARAITGRSRVMLADEIGISPNALLRAERSASFDSQVATKICSYLFWEWKISFHRSRQVLMFEEHFDSRSAGHILSILRDSLKLRRKQLSELSGVPVKQIAAAEDWYHVDEGTIQRLMDTFLGLGIAIEPNPLNHRYLLLEIVQPDQPSLLLQLRSVDPSCYVLDEEAPFFPKVRSSYEGDLQAV